MANAYQRIAHQIDMIGRDVATFYEPVVADMHQVRMKARQFEDLTGQLRSASQNSDEEVNSDGQASILKAAENLRDAIGQARDIVSEEQLRSILKNMQFHCDQLVRYSKELNSLSFLMLVTTASATTSGFTVEHLVSELRKMGMRLNSASSDISATLSLVDGVRQDTGKILSDTHKLIVVSLGELETLEEPGSVDALSISSGDTPERMAASLSADLAKLLPGLIACMQHPDAFAQRCAHVAAATRILDEDLNEDTDIALRKLIAAQLDDICEELNSIQADALQTLQSLSQKGADTLVRFRQHLENDTRLDQIAAQKDKVSNTRQKLTNINNVSQTALVDLSACVKQFDGVEATFGQLNAMRKGVRTSFLNADLSERRAKINMPELRSVTKAVGECATSCGATIDELGSLYQEINAAFGRVDEQTIGQAIAVVEDVLSISRDELDCISGQVESIRTATTACSKALDEMTALGKSAHARIASNVMAVKQLGQISDDLCGDAKKTVSDESKLDVSVFARVFESYSIESERDVHSKVLPEISEAKGAEDRLCRKTSA